MAKNCEVLIIGAGVVGLSTGIALLQGRPSLKVFVAEKEKFIAMHASGRNSGVIHAGFHYSKDSLKAKFCRDGNFELRILAKKYEIPVKKCRRGCCCTKWRREFKTKYFFSTFLQYQR